MKYPNIIQLEVSGSYALFTDPMTKAGGEKCSYPVPTYEALKGMLCSVYWVPSIQWVVDSVRIMEPISTESHCVPTRFYFQTGSGISVCTYLKNVRYQISAHFTEKEGCALSEADEHRHFRMAHRSLVRGGRRDIYLGTRDCTCHAEPCSFLSGNGCYDDTCMDFGMMFHSFIYGSDGVPVSAGYFRCIMDNGIIRFPLPQECRLQQLKTEQHHVV